MKKLLSSLYFQVLIGISLGIVLGYFRPDLGKELKPVADAFIRLIKMMIARSYSVRSLQASLPCRI